MKLFTDEQQESHENAKFCYIYRQKFEDKYTIDKKYRKFRDHFHYIDEHSGAEHCLYSLNYSVRKEIIFVSYNRSNYDYHFMIKELAEKSEEQLTCLGKNTDKYITFSVPTEKEVMRIDRKGTKTPKLYLIEYNLLIP